MHVFLEEKDNNFQGRVMWVRLRSMAVSIRAAQAADREKLQEIEEESFIQERTVHQG